MRSRLVFEEQSLSYGGLDARSNQAGASPARPRLGPEVVVGLCGERSSRCESGSSASSRAGGAYLPLDPVPARGASPSCWLMPARRCLVTHAAVQKALLALARGSCGWMPTTPPSPATPRPRRQPPPPHNTAYVIYTQGLQEGRRRLRRTDGIPNWWRPRSIAFDYIRSPSPPVRLAQV